MGGPSYAAPDQTPQSTPTHTHTHTSLDTLDAGPLPRPTRSTPARSHADMATATGPTGGLVPSLSAQLEGGIEQIMNHLEQGLSYVKYMELYT